MNVNLQAKCGLLLSPLQVKAVSLSIVRSVCEEYIQQQQQDRIVLYWLYRYFNEISVSCLKNILKFLDRDLDVSDINEAPLSLVKAVGEFYMVSDIFERSQYRNVISYWLYRYINELNSNVHGTYVTLSFEWAMQSPNVQGYKEYCMKHIMDPSPLKQSLYKRIRDAFLNRKIPPFFNITEDDLQELHMDVSSFLHQLHQERNLELCFNVDPKMLKQHQDIKMHVPLVRHFTGKWSDVLIEEHSPKHTKTC